MSKCISQHGEFSSHELDPLHTCTLCGVLDEDALRAELVRVTAERDQLRGERGHVWVLLYSNPQDEHDNGMVGVYATEQLARDAAIERANWGHRGPKRVFFWQEERLVFEVSGAAFEHWLHYRVEACEVSGS